MERLNQPPDTGVSFVPLQITDNLPVPVGKSSFNLFSPHGYRIEVSTGSVLKNELFGKKSEKRYPGPGDQQLAIFDSASTDDQSLEHQKPADSIVVAVVPPAKDFCPVGCRAAQGHHGQLAGR